MAVVGEYQYDEDCVLGSGSSAVVFGGKHIPTGRSVALKRFALTNSEITLSMLREAHIQLELNHPYVLRVEAVIVCDDFLFLVLEYMGSDMRERLCVHTENYMQLEVIKEVMGKVLSGLAYLHAMNIIHRDIKPENIFVSNKELKIADFGSARGFSSDGSLPYSADVVTVDYRAPEVLLGSTQYTEAIDLWAAGCLFAEMWGGSTNPIFVRALESNHSLSAENAVLDSIFRTLGVPNAETWPGVPDLKFADRVDGSIALPLGLGKLVPKLDLFPDAKDLLLKLLHLNPQERISAAQALLHPFFTNSN